MVVNVVKSLSPGFKTFLLNLNNLLAEAAPESGLAIAAHSAVFPLLLDCLWVLNFMVLLEMILEGLTTMASFPTNTIRGILQLFITFPDLKLEVLTVFMALPIVFASKFLGTIEIGASIRLLMAFHMLSVLMIRKAYIE